MAGGRSRIELRVQNYVVFLVLLLQCRLGLAYQSLMSQPAPFDPSVVVDPNHNVIGVGHVRSIYFKMKQSWAKLRRKIK